jgi:tRNA(fMet)-specific endonuclease VapC
MLVLDTDHLTEFQKGLSPEAHRLKRRLEESGDRYATTILTVEETMRGWMAFIRRIPDPQRQIRGYASLQQLFRFFATWDVLPWDEAAVDKFESLKRAKVRIGTMDLTIASIAMANEAMLLTRNLPDFKKVPGLSIADWLS